MKVVILAAGIGRRFNKNLSEENTIPKCMTRINSDQCLLDLNLQRISKYEYIEEILIVTGHKAESINKHVKLNYNNSPIINTIYNSKYKRSVIYSILSAFQSIIKSDENNVLILNGDTIFSDRTFCKIEDIVKKKINSISVLGSFEDNFLPDDMKVNVVNNKLIDVGKKIMNANAVSSGAILLCNKGLQKYIQTIFSEKIEALTTHHGILQLIREKGYEIDFSDLEKRDWYEIDTISDIKNYKMMFSPENK